MSIELGIGLVITLALFVLWAHRMQKDEDKQNKNRLDAKLKTIELEKLIRDERHRAEKAEHELRMGNSPASELIRTLNQFDAPPTVYLNGQLLAPALDYTHGEDGFRFIFNLKVRDVLQVHSLDERTVSILDRPVHVGDVVAITPTGAIDEEASLEQLRAAEQRLIADHPPDEPEPKQTSRYDIIARDDDEESL